MEEKSKNLLNIKFKTHNNTMCMKWLGKSTDRDPGEFILPIYMEMVNECSGLKKKIEMDFRELLYLNSSTIMVISKILESGKQGDVKISVVYKNSIKWQSLCFEMGTPAMCILS